MIFTFFFLIKIQAFSTYRDGLNGSRINLLFYYFRKKNQSKGLKINEMLT
jgi:hypothetical protein